MSVLKVYYYTLLRILTVFVLGKRYNSVKLYYCT